MSFSTSLIAMSNSIVDEIVQHPFVRGIAEGNLPKEAAVRYVSQDEPYLETYLRVFAQAAAIAPRHEDIADFHSRMAILLDGESEAHANLLRYAGANREAVLGQPKLPTLHHYESHLIASAARGDFAEVVAAILPCHHVYVEIGERLLPAVDERPDHPFADWIRFYAHPDMRDATKRLFAMIDREAAHFSAQRARRIEAAYLTSYYLEYRFFEMAYRGETWLPKEAARDVSVS
ncbi:thiaminase II [Alicyclobacillus vulcanalis]|uniref:Aminopyrimidine aminohydrolase n=1 Tax=Alicyclobacillus vulcanalis TaxID=252246 RepID=A0A1N7KVZ3_9BACL|nr:thiaminase II [Alicyclobacillus vulcanalis]SIS65734.1 thiaminase (transcriptional activator TenA) [Alicyclobacillus vulcanalis]